MQNPFKEKTVEEKKEPEAAKLRKMDLLTDLESVEVKKLNPDDVDEVYAIMRKTLWEVGKPQILDVIKAGFSYGAYVERMLAGAGLAWPVFYDEKEERIGSGGPNSVFLEDVALLLAYEGRGIRGILMEEREKAARAAGFAYAIAAISPDWPGGSLEDMIKERGNRMEKAYLSRGYAFKRSKDGILAVKRL